jgi:hypothetical protein
MRVGCKRKRVGGGRGIVHGLAKEGVALAIHEVLDLALLLGALPVGQIALLVLALVLLALGAALVAHERVHEQLEDRSPKVVLLLEHLGPEVEHAVQGRDADERHVLPDERRQHDLHHDRRVHEGHLLEDDDAARARAMEGLN